MHLIDRIVVGCAVLASMIYAFRSLAPRTYRGRVLAMLADWAGRHGDGSRLARYLRAASGSGKGGGCGGCEGCGSEAKTPAQPRSAEVSVPLQQIGRRRPTDGA